MWLTSIGILKIKWNEIFEIGNVLGKPDHEIIPTEPHFNPDVSVNAAISP